MTPAIVIPAYNRPKTLARLLASLDRAHFGQAQPDLVIAIDAGGDQHAAVITVAEAYECNFGRKRIHYHKQNVGLIGNITFCGQLSQEFGSIILLEDDLMVAPYFYPYAQQALTAYANDARIAGISLNALWFNGYTHHPFEPFLDGFDLFFLQVAWFQGIAYTAEMWQAYQQWLAKNPRRSSEKLHAIFGRFPPTEWFPDAMRYLVETDRFFAFPRESHCVNFGLAGTHFEQETSMFQVRLALGDRNLAIPTIEQSSAVYDSFYELTSEKAAALLANTLDMPVALDLNGTKQLTQLEHEHVLTIRPSRRPLQQWGLQMHPPLANVLHDVDGTEICLSKRDDLIWSATAERKIAHKSRRYHERPRISHRRRLRFWIEETWEKFGRK